MDRLTITEPLKTYCKNGDSATTMYRALRRDYGLHNNRLLVVERLCKP